MWNADPKSDPGAHRGFPLFDHRCDGVVMFGLDLPRGDELVDEFIDRLPASARLQVRDDLLFAQNIA